MEFSEPTLFSSSNAHAVGGHRTLEPNSGYLLSMRVLIGARGEQSLGGYAMNRLNIISLSAITITALGVALGSAVAQQKTLEEQLMGTWSLVSVETTQKDGTKVPFVEGSNIKGSAVVGGLYSYHLFQRKVVASAGCARVSRSVTRIAAPSSPHRHVAET